MAKNTISVSDEPVDGVRLGDGMMQSARRLGDGDDEHEVEEELEGSGGASRFVP